MHTCKTCGSPIDEVRIRAFLSATNQLPTECHQCASAHPPNKVVGDVDDAITKKMRHSGWRECGSGPHQCYKCGQVIETGTHYSKPAVQSEFFTESGRDEMRELYCCLECAQEQ